jgi:hypothetical protein
MVLDLRSVTGGSLQFRAMPTRHFHLHLHLHLHLLVLVCALLFAVAGPSAALAQSAGDNQYSDPFGSSGGGGGDDSAGGGGGGGGGNSGSGSSGGGGGGASSGGGGGATTSGSGTTGTGTSGTGTGTGTGTGVSQGPQLARTGSDAVLVALAGAGFLLCGVGLRLRTRAGWQR